jgi:beta-lactamase regulating signal transducer with metallopeptidase domain/uncharacterized protein involved in exopolysaccharide biosynthesis
MTSWIEMTGHPLVQRIGWVLLHFVWQGTLIAGIWVILRSLLRASDARIRYAVACLLLGLMVMSPMITFGMLDAAAAAGLETTFHFGEHGSEPPASSPPSTANDSMAFPAVPEHFAAMLERALPAFVVLWSFGVSLLSLRLFHGFWSVRSIRSRQVRPLDAAWHERLAELQRRFRMSRPVLLFESAIIQVPVVIGWLRPMILVPASNLTGLTPQQLELILAHELAHIRRHDHWVNLAQVLIETLLFYHPAVWWISRDIRAERELCCDDLAVATCGNRMAYARALTTLEILRQQGTAMALGASGGSLIDRVRHIVGRSASTVSGWRRPIGNALVGFGVLLFAAGVGCVALAPRQYVAVCRVAADPSCQMVDGSFESGTSTFDPYFMTTEFARIQSWPVLTAVVEELSLAQRWGRRRDAGATLSPATAVHELRRRTHVRGVRNTSMLEIRFHGDARDGSPQESAEIANKIVEAYVAHCDNVRNAPQRRGIELLEQEVEHQDRLLQEAQAQMDELKRELGVSYLSEGQLSFAFDDDTVRRLEAERVPLRANLEGLSHLHEQLRKLREEDAARFRNTLLNANPDADLSRLMQDLWATETSLAKLRVTVGVDHPESRALAAMQADLDVKVEDRIRGIMTGLEVRISALQAQLDSMHRAIQEAKSREAELTARYAPYFEAKRELENQQKIRDAILLRKLQETVDLQIPPTRREPSVVDPAEPPLRAVPTRRGLGFTLCAAGLMTGLGGLLVRGVGRGSVRAAVS